MRDLHPVRVMHWGLDARGLLMANLVWRRAGLMPVGAVDSRPGKAGLDLGELVGFGERMGVRVSASPAEAMAVSRPDVTLLDAGHRLSDLMPMLTAAMEAGSNVICIGEDLTYPWAVNPDLAERLDDLAHAHGVTLLGTGLQPGFLLDTLVINLTGCCMDVERIRASHFADFTELPGDRLREMGFGLSHSAFAEGLKRGRIRLVGGLIQSVHLIADTLGWRLNEVEETRHPILAAKTRRGKHIHIEPGQVAGCRYTAIARIEGLPRLLLQQEQQVDPAAEAIASEFQVNIEGDPSFSLVLGPALPSDRASAFLAVNMISAVLKAGPGVKTMADLPVPRAVLGDLRQMMQFHGPTAEEALARGWHQSPGN